LPPRFEPRQASRIATAVLFTSSPDTPVAAFWHYADIFAMISFGFSAALHEPPGTSLMRHSRHTVISRLQNRAIIFLRYFSQMSQTL